MEVSPISIRGSFWRSERGREGRQHFHNFLRLRFKKLTKKCYCLDCLTVYTDYTVKLISKHQANKARMRLALSLSVKLIESDLLRFVTLQMFNVCNIILVELACVEAVDGAQL